MSPEPEQTAIHVSPKGRISVAIRVDLHGVALHFIHASSATARTVMFGYGWGTTIRSSKWLKREAEAAKDKVGSRPSGLAVIGFSEHPYWGNSDNIIFNFE